MPVILESRDMTSAIFAAFYERYCDNDAMVMSVGDVDVLHPGAPQPEINR